MAAKSITYGDIARLLEAEGFVRTVVPGSHVLFEHAVAQTSLLLPIEPMNVLAAPRHLTMMKETLKDFGIMKVEELDRWFADPKRYQAV